MTTESTNKKAGASYNMTSLGPLKHHCIVFPKTAVFCCPLVATVWNNSTTQVCAQVCLYCTSLFLVIFLSQIFCFQRPLDTEDKLGNVIANSCMNIDINFTWIKECNFKVRWITAQIGTSQSVSLVGCHELYPVCSLKNVNNVKIIPDCWACGGCRFLLEKQFICAKPCDLYRPLRFPAV